MNIKDNERIAALETEVSSLKVVTTSMDSKLDELLALKHKGMGAVWFASLILGSGLMTFIGNFFNIFKGN